MTKLDISEFVANIFGGAMLGIIIGGAAGKTVIWLFVGAFVCGVFKGARFFADHYRRQKQDRIQP